MPRVLVVDDSFSALGYAIAVLKRAGYEADGAINMAEVVACLDRFQPDAVLVDVEMPELLGTDLVRYLREVYKVTGPIVLLSSKDEQELAELSERCGADGYVRKGSDITAIPSAIGDALAR